MESENVRKAMKWAEDSRPGHPATLAAEIHNLRSLLATIESEISVIAAPMRPDGTWNRDREACRQIAENVLKKMRSA